MQNKLITFLIASMVIPSCIYSMDCGKVDPEVRWRYDTKWAHDKKDEFLFLAVCAKDLPSVKLALEQGAQVNVRSTRYTSLGKTPLAMACEVGCPLIAQHLISSRADCNACDDYGLSPLHDALQNINTPKCVPMVEVLIRNGANAGIPTPLTKTPVTCEGSTPIHTIAEIMQRPCHGRWHESYDIGETSEVLDRLTLILTIIVKEIIHQASRKGEPATWRNTLKELFAKKNASGKAPYELFKKYEQYALRLKHSSFVIHRMPQLERGEQLEYKLFELLHPDSVGQYCHEPFLLEAKVREERKFFDALL